MTKSSQKLIFLKKSKKSIGSPEKRRFLKSPNVFYTSIFRSVDI